MLVVAGGWLVVRLTAPDSSPRDTPAIIIGASPPPMAPRPAQRAPAAETRRVHRALHALGRICKPGDNAIRAGQVRPHVATILDFARRYPQVSFAVHDEMGTTVTLLVVTRASIARCAPALSGRVNRALPPRFRLPGASRSAVP